MVAGVLKMCLKMQQIDEAIRVWNGAISDAKKNEPLIRDKLQGQLLMVDRKSGYAYSMGFWESAEASQKFMDSQLFARLTTEFAKFCEKPPVREQFEIEAGDIEALSLKKAA